MVVMNLQLQEEKVKNVAAATLSLASQIRKDDVLSDDFVAVQLQIGLKKIPKKPTLVKLNLPQGLAKPDADVCIFVKDLNRHDRDYEPSVLHFQELFAKKGVTNVKEIVPVKALRTDYMPYEAKSNLSKAYDIFLADERVVQHLPGILTKAFYGNTKKMPIPVNMLATDLKKEINRGVNSSKFNVSNKGASSMAVIGHSGMSKEALTANVLAAVEQIAAKVPGHASNIQILSLKAQRCTSIPIYLAQGGPQDAKLPKNRKRKLPVEIDELSTLDDGQRVAVYPDGRVVVLREGENLKDAEARIKSCSNSKDTKEKRKQTTGGSAKSKVKKAKIVNEKQKSPTKLKKKKN